MNGLAGEVIVRMNALGPYVARFAVDSSGRRQRRVSGGRGRVTIGRRIR